MKRNFVLLHIPKAGGTTIRSFLANLFGVENVYPEVKLHNFPEYCEVRESRPMLYMSHLGYNFVKDADAVSATILGDPIERILSVYSYTVNPGKGMPLIPNVEKDTPLLEFLKSGRPEIRMNIDNTQTWQIAYGYSMKNRNEFKNKKLGDVLDIAIDNLNNIEFVGITEDISSFKNHVSEYYGETYSADNVVANKTENRLVYADLNEAEKYEIEKIVQNDYVLYEKAREIIATRK